MAGLEVEQVEELAVESEESGVEEREGGSTQWSRREVSVVTAAPARDRLKGPG